MKQIVKGVYLEDIYPGVMVGAIVLKKGIILIDAPPRPDDGRAWLASLRRLGEGGDRLLINMDAHPDRTLGARIMETTVLAQDGTADIFRQRPAIFKSQQADSGAEWEDCNGLSGIRWLQPHLVYSKQAHLHWDKQEVLIEHHPGPEKGASWVIMPECQLVFVGDAVVIDQPPFLANANMDTWLENLDLLLSDQYKDYTIISSRGGVVGENHIRNLRKLLKDIQKRLDRMGKRKSPPMNTERLISRVVAACEVKPQYQEQHTQRVRYGLYHYYARNYQNPVEDVK